MDRLESFSGTRIWAMLKGSRGDDLEQATAKREAALGQLAVAGARRDAAARDLATIRRQLDALGDVDAQLETARQAKEQYLLATQAPDAARLMRLAEERGHLGAQVRELDEAIAAGRAAQAALAAMDSELSTASGWSTYDTFFGGGIIASSIKHSHMDKAAQLSRDADERLATFARELGDVAVASTGASLELSQGTRFLDVWFDNIFTDFSVRGRIKDAQTTATRAHDAVAAQTSECVRRIADVRARLAAIDAERAAALG